MHTPVEHALKEAFNDPLRPHLFGRLARWQEKIGTIDATIQDAHAEMDGDREPGNTRRSPEARIALARVQKALLFLRHPVLAGKELSRQSEEKLLAARLEAQRIFEARVAKNEPDYGGKQMTEEHIRKVRDGFKKDIARYHRNLGLSA